MIISWITNIAIKHNDFKCRPGKRPRLHSLILPAWGIAVDTGPRLMPAGVWTESPARRDTPKNLIISFYIPPKNQYIYGEILVSECPSAALKIYFSQTLPKSKNIIFPDYIWLATVLKYEPFTLLLKPSQTAGYSGCYPCCFCNRCSAAAQASA